MDLLAVLEGCQHVLDLDVRLAQACLLIRVQEVLLKYTTCLSTANVSKRQQMSANSVANLLGVLEAGSITWGVLEDHTQQQRVLCHTM